MHRSNTGDSRISALVTPAALDTNRETREGWALVTVETEVNGDSKSTNERGPFLFDSLGLSCRNKRFLFCLGCSSRTSTKYFFSRRTLFQLLYPNRPASWAGSRAGLPVSSYVSLDTQPYSNYNSHRGDRGGGQYRIDYRYYSTRTVPKVTGTA
jgi:hypothetical protein